MPGGLNEVSQSVGADASKYIAEYRAALAVTKELNAANKELQQTMGASGGSGFSSAAVAEVAKINAAIREQQALLGNHQSVLGNVTQATAGFGAAHAAAAAQVSAAAAAVRDHTGGVSGLTAGYEAARASIAAMASDALRSNEQMAAGFERVRASSAAGSDQIREFSSGVSDLKSSASDTADAVDNVSRSIDALQVKASSAQSVTAKSLTDIGRTMDATAAAAGYASYRSAAIAAFGPPSSPPGGGGGGGGGGGIPPMGGFDKGSFGTTPSGYYGDTVLQFAKRWLPAVHYITMGVAELAATAIPAAAALGAAGLVGIQGGQQLGTRGQAIFSASEALGGTYGVSAGNLLGVGGAYQQAQNLAQGGVYGLAGAGLNLAASGAGSGIYGQGTQTLAMLDRAAANFVTNATAPGGTADKLNAALGGGTQYLRDFGDVAANTGNFLLNMAPNLPGVGEMWLNGLRGITGALASSTGAINSAGLGPVLGAGMAAEAGGRLGAPLLGIAGRGLTGLAGLAGRIPGLGAAGLTTADLADVSALTGVEGLAGLEGVGGSGLAGALGALGAGALTAPTGVVAGGAAAAYLLDKAISSVPDPVTRQLAGEQSQIGQMSFLTGLTPGAGGGAPAGTFQTLVKAIANAQTASTGPGGMTAQQYMQQVQSAPGAYSALMQSGAMPDWVQQGLAVKGFQDTLKNLVGAGPQVASILDSLGVKGATSGQGLQVAQSALLELGNAFDSTGKLSKTSQQQISDYVKAYAPMTAAGATALPSINALQAAIGAGTVMSSPQMDALSKVNTALDSMTNIAAGGPSGIAALTAQTAGLGDITALGKALTSFTSPAGTAAWTAFASTSTSKPGVIENLQSNMDQLRSYQVENALSGVQGAGLTAAYIKPLLGSAKQSPAALALLEQQAMQQQIPGVGYYQTGAGAPSQAQQYKTFSEAVTKFADTPKQLNQVMNNAVVASSQTPKLGQEFATGVNPQYLAAAQAQVSKDILAIQGAGGVGTPGGKSALTDAIRQLQSPALGLGGASQIKAAIDPFLSPGALAGVNTQINTAVAASQPKLTPKITPPDGNTTAAAMTEIGNQLKASEAVKVAPKVDPGSLGAFPPMNIPTKVEKPMLPPAGTPNPVVYTSKVDKPLPPPPPPGGTVQYGSHVATPVAPPAPAGGTVVYHSQVLAPVAPAAPTPSGAIPFTTAVTRPAPSAPGTIYLTSPDSATVVGGGGRRLLAEHLGGLIHAAGGFMVPGTGSGDVVPAMLEPGEAVVPRNLVGLLAPFLAAHGVPGFSGPAGGLLEHALSLIAAMPGTKGFAAGGVVGGGLSQIKSEVASAWTSLDALYKQEDAATGSAFTSLKTQIASFWKNTLDPLYAQEDKLTGKKSGTSASTAATTQAAKSVADQFVVSLSGAIKSNLTSSGAAGIAQGLVSQIQQEIAYANTTSAGIVSGLNFGSMQVPAASVAGSSTPAAPGTKGYNATAWNNYIANYSASSQAGLNGPVAQPQSVQQQMQGYLGSIQQFSTDVGTLSKGHLNKALLQQVISAGPTQGDALAQSIIGGQGGIGAVNNLYSKINTAANKFGMSAAGSMYGGGHVSSGSVGATVNNVSVNVSIGGGGSALDLSAGQIKTLTADIQAALLKQAKRNRKTGVTLKPPKSS